MTCKLTIYKSLMRDEVLKEISTDEKTLSEAIYACKELHGLHVCSWVNHTPIPADDWHLFELNTFDHIYLVAQPERGSLPYIGAIVGASLAFIAPALWPAGTTLFAAALKGAIIGYALGSVVDSLIWPNAPLTGDSDSNSNYGWDGARLVTRPDGPVSVLYGQYRISGTPIQSYISTDGSKNYLHLLLGLCEGPIEGIMKSDGSGVCSSTSDDPDIEINGQAFSSFENCTWDYRLGTWDQTVISGFHGTKTYYADGRRILKGTSLTYTTTGIDIQTLEIQVHCPNLFYTLANGEQTAAYVDFDVEYSVHGADSWTRVEGPRPGGYQWIDGLSKTTIYKYITISDLAANEYDIRITRITPEYTSFKNGGDLYLTGVTEQTNQDIAYRFTALLALHLQATDQLQGTTPNITVEVRGRKVSVPKLTIASVTQIYDDCYYDDNAGVYKLISNDSECTDSGDFVEQWSRHPIWCSRDFHLNDRYGLGEYIDSNSWDDDLSATEAKYCWQLVTDFDGGHEHRFEMDLPISTYMSAPEATKMLARTFRGWIPWMDGKYKPVIDRERDATWLFNSSNMFPKTMRTTYFKASQIPNVVELQYADKDRDYVINTLEIVDESEWTDTKPLRKNTINAIGTVRSSQNLRDGKYYLNCGLYCKKSVEFEVPEHLLRTMPGDTVRLQNDLLAWGIGGRIISATLTSITVNRDVTFTSDYKVRVRLSDFSLEEKTVSSVTNNNRTINISGSFTSTPLVDSVWTYGASDVDSKPFQVKSVTRIEESKKYKLLLTEESSSKYSDTSNVSLPDPDYSSLPNPADLPENIEDLSLTEMSNRPGFYISFNIPQEDINFHHADVLLSLDESNYWAYRTNVKAKSDIEVPNAKAGVTYYVKVISYNHLGIANTSPETASITLTDTNFKPPQINGLRLDGESSLGTSYFTKKDAKFTWVKTSNVEGAGHLPAGQEALGAGQFFNETILKYWIEIYVSDSMVRKEIITDNHYVYTYEKNLADNSGTPTDSFKIRVWAFNENANLKSTYSSDLEVSNPDPDPITGLQITGTGSTTAFIGKDINVSWTAPSDPDILNYKVIISKTDDTVLRTEYTTDTFYSYTFDKNSDDNSESPLNSIKVTVYAQDWFYQLSTATTITVTNPVPSDVTGLTATAYPRAISFDWTRNSEVDISHYEYRIQVESDGWSGWTNTNTNHVLRTLSDSEISDHTSECNIQIEVKAVDTFGNESASAATADEDTLSMSIAATDIDDFAITASKNFTKIPVLESDSWTNNSPSAGYVAWNEHTIYYNGVGYTIAAGNTNEKYIYWLNGLSVYNTSDTNPTLTVDDFVIAVNIDGTHDIAWNAIANQVIGSAYIEDAAITNAKIVDLAAEKIVASSLSSISANLGIITAGYIESVDIVSSTFKTAPTGKRIQITSEGIVLWTTDLTGKWSNFTWGDGTLWGSGALAYIQHNSYSVPFYIASEQTVADFHFYNRGSSPSGAAEIGDICVISGELYICTSAGTPGTWTRVGVGVGLEGTELLSTGESGGTKYLREDGDGTCSWQTISLSSLPFILASDYGVDPSESATNNTTYLQNAIDAADSAGGQTVVLPAGTIQINSAIEMGGRDEVKIVGCGVGATDLQTTSATAHVFHWTSTARWQEFSDFTISCSTTKSAGAFFYAASAVYRTMWKRLKLKGWYDGIKLDGYEVCFIKECQIAEPSGSGAAIIAGKVAGAAQGANLTIENVLQRGTNGTDGVGGTVVGNYGLVIYDADAVFVVNSDFGGNLLNDMLIAPSTRSDNNHFVQTYFDATKNGDCILFAGAGISIYNTFTGCWVASAGQETGGASTVRGINVPSGYGAVHFNFTGGRIFNCKGNGVDVRASSPNINFTGTKFEFNGGGGSVGHRWGAYIDTGLNNTSASFKSCCFVGSSNDGSIYYGTNCCQYFLTDNSCEDDIYDLGTAYMAAHNTENGGTPYP